MGLSGIGSQFRLSLPHWVYVFVILLIVLPTCSGFVFHDRIYAWYLHEFVGPKLQKEFGFKAGNQIILERKESSDVFVIKDLSHGGIAASGFHSGDIPIGYKHGFESGFYQDLVWSRDGVAKPIWVVNIDDARRGNWQWHKVILLYHKQNLPALPDPEKVGDCLGAVAITKDVTQPLLLNRVEPSFPKEAMRKKRRASPIIAEAVITKEGEVRCARILRSEQDDLNAAMLDAITKWKYKPALKNGKPIAVYFIVTVFIHLK